MNKTLFALAADFDNLNHAEILKAVFNQDPQAFLLAVEATPNFEVEATPAWVTEVINLVKTPGQPSRVAAIKALRTATGLGLKEAKDVVDTLMGATNEDTRADPKILNQFIKAGFVVPMQAPTVPQVPDWYGSLQANLNAGFLDDASSTIRRNSITTVGDANDLIDLLRGKTVGASLNTLSLFNEISRAGFKPTKNLWEPCPDWMKSFVDYLEKGEVSKARQLMSDCCRLMFTSDVDEVIDALSRSSYESVNSQAQFVLNKFKEHGLKTTSHSWRMSWMKDVIDQLNTGNDGNAFDIMADCGVKPFLIGFERYGLFRLLRGAKPDDSGKFFTQDTLDVYQQFVDAGLSVSEVTSWYQEVVKRTDLGMTISAADVIEANTDLCMASCNDVVYALRGFSNEGMTDAAKLVLKKFTDLGLSCKVTE